MKASPRCDCRWAAVPRGGGRELVGDPYQVKGKTYVPKEDPNYNKSGLASWYGSAFHGRLTANGEIYDTQYISAAHPTFPLPSYARVTNLDTGTSLIVRVNDRGPTIQVVSSTFPARLPNSWISRTPATAHVNVQYVGRARMDGRDMPFMIGLLRAQGRERLPRIGPEGQIATGVMVASNQSFKDQLQNFGRYSSNSPEPAPIFSSKQPTKPSVPAAHGFTNDAQVASVAPQAQKAPIPLERRTEVRPLLLPLLRRLRRPLPRSIAAPTRTGARSGCPT